MNPYFALAEYHDRAQRAQRLLAAAGLDALFISGDRNLYYLTGHQPLGPTQSATRPTALLMPRTGAPVLVAPEAWAGAAAHDSWIADVVTYNSLEGIPNALLAGLFRQQGLAQGRIGAELGLEQRLGMPPRDFAALQQALPAADWADAADVLWELRLIKSPAEVDCLRRACAAAMSAFATVFPTLAPGMTQEQVVHQLQAAICQAGAEPGFIIPVFGPETAQAQLSLPTADPIAAGDVIWVDMGAVYHGYWCDFCRSVSLDAPPAAHLNLWEAVHRTTMAGVQAVRPGVTFRQVVEACAAEAERQGLDLSFSAEIGRLGHGIGLLLTEPPSVTLHNETVLVPGMTFTLEPGIVGPSGVFVVEQNVAVTPYGVELLSAGQWEMWRA